MATKNDAAGIQTLKDFVLKSTHIAMMKHRGLPQDHIDVVEMSEELVQIAIKFKNLMAEDAEQFTNLPNNVVAFRPTAH